MHIAICDDNAADRKQTERLLGREADKWIAIGDPVYIITFGSVESLLENFMQFDAILMDIKESEGLHTKEGIAKLSEIGSQSTIVLHHKEDMPQEKDEKLLLLEKPILKAELHDVMLKVKEHSGKREPLIELRGEKETLYVKEADILYAEEKGSFVHVTLQRGKVLKMFGRLETLYDEITDLHPVFYCPSRKLMINLGRVSESRLFTVYMENGTGFTIGPSAKKIVEMSKEYK